MNTSICSTGTADDDMLAGKNSYCAANNLSINSQIVYTDTFDPVGGSSWADLIEQVQDALDDGCDVEILIAWNATSGHAAMVTAVMSHANGSATIHYVEDNQAEPGAQNKEPLIATDASGNFGGTRRVDGFMIECVPD
jgi:hypothetical protein